MTPAAEASFLTTLIPVFLGGVVSALVTLMLGQPLQHYFWRRQRLAERQLATLDEFNKVTAQLLHHGWMDYETATAEQRALHLDRGEPVFLALLVLLAQVRVLFSPSAIEAAEELVSQLVALGNSVADKPWQQAVAPVNEARVKALRSLYEDMGISSQLTGHWMRRRVWQPLRVRVWDPRWKAQMRPMMRQLWARTRLRRSCMHRTPSDP